MRIVVLLSYDALTYTHQLRYNPGRVRAFLATFLYSLMAVRQSIDTQSMINMQSILGKDRLNLAQGGLILRSGPPGPPSYGTS